MCQTFKKQNRKPSRKLQITDQIMKTSEKKILDLSICRELVKDVSGDTDSWFNLGHAHSEVTSKNGSS